MNHTQELEKTLAELNRTTGLSLSIAAGSEEEAEAALSKLKCLSTAYKEKYNKTHFLQNLLSDSIPSYAVSDMALRLHIDPEVNRFVFLIETRSVVDDTITEVLKSLFPSSSKSYLVTMSEKSIVLIRPVKSSDEENTPLHIARSIVDTLNTEALVPIHISYSSVSRSLMELSQAYSNVCLAMKVGKLFYSEQTVFSYDNLGIGQLIYELPEHVCYKFLNEVFHGNVPESFDEETTHTINKFIQNNLNIAETSRQLHMHRNTLIYRLEQIEKQTGLDLRTFEDAMIFNIATMVLNYLQTERNS